MLVETEMQCVCVCVFQRKSWKRRFFTLDDNAVSYYKSEMVRRLTLFPLMMLRFFSVTELFVCPCLNCAYLCPRIRSHSDLFH